MLEVLRIRNFVVIEKADLNFTPGLNVLSGETGSGKSVILEAIALLLGGRAHIDSIRHGKSEAVIEGILQFSEQSPIAKRLERFGFPCESNELLVKRSIHRHGRHRISINGEMATLSTLQALMEGTLDLCSQHEHLSLGTPLRQLEFLDQFGHLTKQTKALQNLLSEYKTLLTEYKTLKTQEVERERRIDFLEFQINELQAAQLEDREEEQKLNDEKKLIQTSSQRRHATQDCLQLLHEEERGITVLLKSLSNRLKVLMGLDEEQTKLFEICEKARIDIEELDFELARYDHQIELDPERINDIQARLNLIHDLKRKYGPSIEALFEAPHLLKQELDELKALEGKSQALVVEMEELRTKALKEGQALSFARQTLTTPFSEAIQNQLKDLKMEKVRLEVRITFNPEVESWNYFGGDDLELLIETNPGQGAHPIGRIASGGELSRLMLAFRQILAEQNQVAVFLFDEIDSGIGGQTAFEVGKKLKTVSQYNQVICITHLPQIASFANQHFAIQKLIEGNETHTECFELDPKAQKEEIARMLAGPNLTSRTLDSASELIELATAHTSQPKAKQPNHLLRVL